jgi:hypothetical protein
MQISAAINAFKNWAKMNFTEVDIYLFGIILIGLSIVAVVVIAWRYEKQRRKIKELQSQYNMVKAKIYKLTGGSKKPRL